MTIKVGNKEFSLDGYVNDFQKVLVEIYQQGRADGIDEFKNYLLKHKKLVREFETDYVYESVKIEFITDTGAEE